MRARPHYLYLIGSFALFLGVSGCLNSNNKPIELAKVKKVEATIRVESPVPQTQGYYEQIFSFEPFQTSWELRLKREDSIYYDAGHRFFNGLYADFERWRNNYRHPVRAKLEIKEGFDLWLSQHKIDHNKTDSLYFFRLKFDSTLAAVYTNEPKNSGGIVVRKSPDKFSLIDLQWLKQQTRESTLRLPYRADMSLEEIDRWLFAGLQLIELSLEERVKIEALSLPLVQAKMLQKGAWLVPLVGVHPDEAHFEAYQSLLLADWWMTHTEEVEGVYYLREDRARIRGKDLERMLFATQSNLRLSLSPNRLLRRKDVLINVWRALGKPTENAPMFRDISVPNELWVAINYFQNVEKMEQHEWFNGSKLMPNKAITDEELVHFLHLVYRPLERMQRKSSPSS
jgi:hypothetical protein